MTASMQIGLKGSVWVALVVYAFGTLVPVLVEAQPMATESADAIPFDLAIATTTEALVSNESDLVPATDWFTREQLFGQVDVGDFVVGPGRAVLELKPGETTVFEISVSNRISDNRTFFLKVEDIAGSQNPTEGIRALGDTIGPYSIQEFISFPDSSFELGLGERARIPVTISIPPDAEPGGYYGAVFVSTTRTEPIEVQANTAQSPVIARIGAQFFITIPGVAEESSVVRAVSLVPERLWYERGPIEFAITTENTGSVHLVVGADVAIRNMFGEEVGLLEAEPWFVLPQSVRLRTLSWDREFLLGRYTAVVRVARGHDDLVDTQTLSFWVLPWRIVGGLFLVIFISLFVLRTFFRTFEFKRKVT